MIPFLRKYILGGSDKNPSAPQVLLILLVFIAATTTYYALLFSIDYLLVRLTLSIAKIAVYIALERSRLSNETLSFLNPVVILLFLHTATLHFNGDFLIFSYTLGGAMISLTYMKPKGILIYIAIISSIQAFLMFGLGLNLMGANFTMAQNYGGFITAVALNMMIYFYAKVYQAKNAFLSNMSHEIRTPITAVLGISEIRLQSKDVPPEIEESFIRIHNSAKLLLGIINDMLDFSKLEDGKMTVLQEEYETVSMISSFAHLNYDRLKDKDIEFNLYVDEKLPIVLVGDALRIEQIMINLLSNAFKYTDTGSIDLNIRCRPSAEGTITLVCTVRDTGIGMTKEQLETIYTAYTRFHEKTKRSTIGTGLGMSIVYKIINLMGGHIKMESVVGKGTIVTVSIPQKMASPEVLGKDTTSRLQKFETYASNEDAKIFKFTPEPMPYGSVLIVDDIETNLFVAKGLLAFYGLKVETCNSGNEALEKIKQGKVYDLILMDYMMPTLTGTETMRMMRDMRYINPIVVLTANAMTGVKEEYIRSGFDDFLSKPIITKNLNDILMKHIRHKQPREVIEAALKSNKKTVKQKDIDDYQSNSGLVEKLRVDFAKNQKNAFANILQALDADDPETAHRLAHSIKGLAALIHESALSQAAEHVENLLDSGKKPTNKALSALEYELKNVLDSISLPEVKASYDMEVLAKLKPLLEHRKAECLELLDELRFIPETAIISRQMQKLDFGGALKSLNVLIAILEE